MFLFLLVILVLAAAGCTSSRSEPLTPEETAERDALLARAMQSGEAWVFVNGEQKGTTPLTIQVRRGFEENDISLRVGPKFYIIRQYEVERTVTSNRRQLDFSFGNSNMEGTYRTLDIEDLRTTKNGTILIPYYEEPIQIEDHQFHLVIRVTQ